MKVHTEKVHHISERINPEHPESTKNHSFLREETKPLGDLGNIITYERSDFFQYQHFMTE